MSSTPSQVSSQVPVQRRGAGWTVRLAVVALAALAFGCTISPVVSPPGDPSGPYSDCRRAADDYCEDVLGKDRDDMRRCVSEHTYRCLSGAS